MAGATSTARPAAACCSSDMAWWRAIARTRPATVRWCWTWCRMRITSRRPGRPCCRISCAGHSRRRADAPGHAAVRAAMAPRYRLSFGPCPSGGVPPVSQPKAPGAEPRTELTVRGLIIGVVITVVFTAANVFFGLKAGLTFATSIPAAVISMALLRGFKDSTIQENNIVQTIASAAGTLSSIIFVLPGMIIIGWWTGFPFWLSFAVCALGGVLGVMYSIPLRRALVTTSDLPYPEGVACAEVLKVGAGEIGSDPAEGKAGLLAVIWGAVVSAVFAIVVATQIFAADVASYFRIGNRGATSGF